MLQEKFQVTVVEGRNLKGSDIIGNADPYVCLSLDRQNKQRTRTLQGAGQNAYWNQSIELHANPGQNQLYVEVYNENVGLDQFIGDAVLTLPQIPHHDQWIHIQQSGIPAGEIHLTITKSQGLGYQPPVQQAYASYPSYGEQPPQYQPTAPSSLGPAGGSIPAGYGSAPPPPVPAGLPGYAQPPPGPIGFAQPQPAPYAQPPPPAPYAQPPAPVPYAQPPPPPQGYPGAYIPQATVGHDVHGVKSAHSKDKKDKKGSSHATTGHAQPPPYPIHGEAASYMAAVGHNDRGYIAQHTADPSFFKVVINYILHCKTSIKEGVMLRAPIQTSILLVHIATKQSCSFLDKF
ncbi:10714_t:CDS:2 [Paraglomus brasilianum]|uniref:10714_t:CDS:1 n=1 Tax=Paraglomus brasilianum TaxID=144538 RepID=A0A9N8YY76_9GLOM|nr:10714_t:CDS:2 [Paraglomus brasilianum]